MRRYLAFIRLVNDHREVGKGERGSLDVYVNANVNPSLPQRDVPRVKDLSFLELFF